MSGAEALAALGPTAGENLHAALGLHAGTEAVAAFAHEAARLIGAFHGVSLLKLLRIAAKRACGKTFSPYARPEIRTPRLPTLA